MLILQLIQHGEARVGAFV